LPAGEYQVIQDRKVDGFARTSQFSHCVAIGPAWSHIPAGVIMRQDDSCAAQLCRIDDDIPDRQFDRFQLPVIAFDVEAAGSSVDMSHPKPLELVVSWTETCRKEAASGIVAVEDGGFFSALEPHAPRLMFVRPTA
jgi:hypothetical protein